MRRLSCLTLALIALGLLWTSLAHAQAMDDSDEATAAAAAPSATESVAAEPAALADSTPKAPAKGTRGVVIGDRLHVRTQPRITSGHLYQAFKGDEFVVVGSRGEWIEVLLPESASAWVAKQYVDKAPDSDRGVVRGDRVCLRAGGGREYDRIGLVNRGYPFVVLGEVAEYYKVKPVPGATAFLHNEFVRMKVIGDTVDTGDVPVTPGTPASLKQRLDAVRADITTQEQKDLLDRNYTDIITELVAIINQSRDVDPFLNLTAQKTLGEVYKARQVQANEQAKVERMKHIDQMLQDIEDKHAGSISPTAPAAYLAKGVVEKFSLPYPPATHKLVEGDNITYLLYSDDLDLSQLVGKRVGVVGSVSQMTRVGVSLIKVTRIDSLEAAPQ